MNSDCFVVAFCLVRMVAKCALLHMLLICSLRVRISLSFSLLQCVTLVDGPRSVDFSLLRSTGLNYSRLRFLSKRNAEVSSYRGVRSVFTNLAYSFKF